MTKRSFFILKLILLVVFLVFPKVSLAIEFDDIDLRTLGKHLVLPENRVQDLIYSLIGIFYDEFENMMTDRWYSLPYPTPEETAVPRIMKAVVKVQSLNHLLIDAPLQVTWKIISNTVKIVRLILTKEISVILEEIEKESVKKATEYGMKFLLQNELRITPGAIIFEYTSKNGIKKEALLQYIMIYQPIDRKRGKILIRFYSPNYLEPPESKADPWGSAGIYIEATTDIPPFVVDIDGKLDNFKWADKPSINIDFPSEVPDLGIKPLSFWEKNFLQPIKTKIKEAEVIITKVTGRKNIVEDISKTATDVWNNIKSTISKLNPFGPAAIVQSSIQTRSEKVEKVKEETEVLEEKIEEIKTEEVKAPKSEVVEVKPKQSLTLEEIQERLDDIAEQIDVLSVQLAELAKEKGVKLLLKDKDKEKEKNEEEKGSEKLVKKDLCQPNSININTSSAIELQKITEVGSTIAQRIIEARPFYSLNDLIKVKGIGSITLQKIIAQGCAYVDQFYASLAGGSGGGGSSDGESSPPSYPKILISEVQIWDANSTDNDFIELYNPNSDQVDLSGWQLKKKNSTGKEESIKVFPSGSIIPGHGYFLWLNKNYASSSQLQADATSSQILAQNNSIALLDPNKNIVDALAWGSSTDPFLETAAFPQNPEKNKSLGRKWSTSSQSYIDSDNNSTDFEIQTPTPKAQNQSPIPQPPTPPLTVVINEIAWMGTKASPDDEWIELYNTTKNPVDLTGWKLKSLTDDSPNITFSGTISPLGFYLLERTTSITTNVSEDQIYTGSLNNNPNCEILVLYDQNNNLVDKTICLENGSWPAGKASPDYLSMERINPRTSGENIENWANNNQVIKNGQDAAGNSINGTPRSQNSVYQSLPPNQITDLTLDQQNSYGNQVILNWSTTTDPDTLSENLSYFVYYAKTEDELTSSSTTQATTTLTTITISNLDYNSTYYFGLRAFDGQNYSLLSTTTPYQTPSALNLSPWPMFGANPQRNNQSNYSGPNATPTVIWVFSEDSDPNNPNYNPLYTSPIIGPDGTIFSSVIFPTSKKGILALNPDGSKKWFRKEEMDSEKVLALNPDGSLFEDEKKIVKDKNDNIYLVNGNLLSSFDRDGKLRWQRGFEFPDLQNHQNYSGYDFSLLNPVISTGGIIYLLAEGKIYFDGGGTMEHLYLFSLSPEDGNQLFSVPFSGGYRSGPFTVSSSETSYFFYLIYGFFQSNLYLSSVADGKEIWTIEIVSNYSLEEPSPLIIDNQENLYFVLGKEFFALNKNGEELWRVSLFDYLPSDWDNAYLGVALNYDGTLYLSGRGAIVALK